ncbi:unnamed protein product [Ilex paraguariensis]|uniref:Uncharacterized protein n=1 Tax=Ilex paraguariensis TaxID=185542 RepID=A0ABC8URT9_9AQUA
MFLSMWYGRQFHHMLLEQGVETREQLISILHPFKEVENLKTAITTDVRLIQVLFNKVQGSAGCISSFFFLFWLGKAEVQLHRVEM